MKIGAFQFAVSGNMGDNMSVIERAVETACREGVRLLVFPECALTGYPPHDIPASSDVDADGLSYALKKLQLLADIHNMTLIVGAVTPMGEAYHNSAIVMQPGKAVTAYHKRALWGWDRDNFAPGEREGIVEIDGFQVGIRICFEVRFPEYFRELYRAGTDLNVILFYDVSDWDDVGRYDLIRGHIRTRAVENVTHTLTVNTIRPYQTAPTALYDRSGGVLAELARNREGLLIYELDKTPLDFGEQGRKELSDKFI